MAETYRTNTNKSHAVRNLDELKAVSRDGSYISRDAHDDAGLSQSKQLTPYNPQPKVTQAIKSEATVAQPAPQEPYVPEPKPVPQEVQRGLSEQDELGFLFKNAVVSLTGSDELNLHKQNLGKAPIDYSDLTLLKHYYNISDEDWQNKKHDLVTKKNIMESYVKGLMSSEGGSFNSKDLQDIAFDDLAKNDLEGTKKRRDIFKSVAVDNFKEYYRDNKFSEDFEVKEDNWFKLEFSPFGPRLALEDSKAKRYKEFYDNSRSAGYEKKDIDKQFRVIEGDLDFSDSASSKLTKVRNETRSYYSKGQNDEYFLVEEEAEVDRVPHKQALTEEEISQKYSDYQNSGYGGDARLTATNLMGVTDSKHNNVVDRVDNNIKISKRWKDAYGGKVNVDYVHYDKSNKAWLVKKDKEGQLWLVDPYAEYGLTGKGRIPKRSVNADQLGNASLSIGVALSLDGSGKATDVEYSPITPSIWQSIYSSKGEMTTALGGVVMDIAMRNGKFYEKFGAPAKKALKDAVVKVGAKIAGKTAVGAVSGVATGGAGAVMATASVADSVNDARKLYKLFDTLKHAKDFIMLSTPTSVRNIARASTVGSIGSVVGWKIDDILNYDDVSMGGLNRDSIDVMTNLFGSNATMGVLFLGGAKVAGGTLGAVKDFVSHNPTKRKVAKNIKYIEEIMTGHGKRSVEDFMKAGVSEEVARDSSNRVLTKNQWDEGMINLQKKLNIIDDAVRVGTIKKLREAKTDKGVLIHDPKILDAVEEFANSPNAIDLHFNQAGKHAKLQDLARENDLDLDELSKVTNVAMSDILIKSGRVYRKKRFLGNPKLIRISDDVRILRELSATHATMIHLNTGRRFGAEVLGLNFHGVLQSLDATGKMLEKYSGEELAKQILNHANDFISSHKLLRDAFDEQINKILRSVDVNADAIASKLDPIYRKLREGGNLNKEQLNSKINNTYETDRLGKPVPYTVGDNSTLYNSDFIKDVIVGNADVSKLKPATKKALIDELVSKKAIPQHMADDLLKLQKQLDANYSAIMTTQKEIFNKDFSKMTTKELSGSITKWYTEVDKASKFFVKEDGHLEFSETAKSILGSKLGLVEASVIHGFLKKAGYEDFGVATGGVKVFNTIKFRQLIDDFTPQTELGRELKEVSILLNEYGGDKNYVQLALRNTKAGEEMAGSGLTVDLYQRAKFLVANKVWNAILRIIPLTRSYKDLRLVNVTRKIMNEPFSYNFANDVAGSIKGSAEAKEFVRTELLEVQRVIKEQYERVKAAGGEDMANSIFLNSKGEIANIFTETGEMNTVNLNEIFQPHEDINVYNVRGNKSKQAEITKSFKNAREGVYDPRIQPRDGVRYILDDARLKEYKPNEK